MRQMTATRLLSTSEWLERKVWTDSIILHTLLIKLGLRSPGFLFDWSWLSSWDVGLLYSLGLVWVYRIRSSSTYPSLKWAFWFLSDGLIKFQSFLASWNACLYFYNFLFAFILRSIELSLISLSWSLFFILRLADNVSSTMLSAS